MPLWDELHPDGRYADDRRAAYSYLDGEQTAMDLSLLTGQSLDLTLIHLKVLHRYGAVRYRIDRAGIVRWQRILGNAWASNPPF